ncbi:cbb3-type cytochrome oxidase assembly protein CcoS [Alphaproteobacteria bacterium KMM 3653]|uniref:Cbb3-type cytochrome oxidase assembly protein CcoS n=1 Tax=Harenicola maris TaxID=2841044 RepID=A0AAP2CQ98_9RHOB|nr:cbb3-type cytochrome oxidase assembly protein CcoS [Harenicola maris]
MNVLIILVPVSLTLAALALIGFIWTLRRDQYDDLEGDAWRILSEDETPKD